MKLYPDTPGDFARTLWAVAIGSATLGTLAIYGALMRSDYGIVQGLWLFAWRAAVLAALLGIISRLPPQR
jgi:hypothetical protein